MGKKLFVGNLSFSVNDQVLGDIFAQCGTVESAKVITDRDTGRSKGFGFVEMSSDAEAQDAISKFNNTEQSGRPISVSEARPAAPRREGGGFGGGARGGAPRGGGGGGGGGGRGRF